MSIYDSGFNNLLVKDPLFQNTVQSVNAFMNGVASEKVTSGEMGANVNLVAGFLQSSNFVTGSTGWQINSDGNVEFDSGYFRGDISAATGTFAGSLSVANLTAGTISSKAITLAVAAGIGDVYFNAGKTDFNNTVAGFILGLDDSDSDTAKFYIGSTTIYFNWDGSNLIVVGGTITGGTIQTATSGYRVKLNGSNSKIELLSGDTVQSSIYNDANAKLTLDTLDSIVFRRAGTGYLTFDYNSDRTCMDIQMATNAYLYWSSGRYIKGEASLVEVNGDFCPSADNVYKCGTTGQRWSVGNFEDINVDDITVNNSFGGCGSIAGCAYIEVNLLNEEDIEQRRVDLKNGERKNYTGFELGDVLCYGSRGLKKSDYDTAMCVTAISDKEGMPVVIGAEPIKVVGKIAMNQFLVTSSISGVARGWDNKLGNPPIGCVIGQSMESKDDNEIGLIRAMIRKF